MYVPLTLSGGVLYCGNSTGEFIMSKVMGKVVNVIVGIFITLLLMFMGALFFSALASLTRVPKSEEISVSSY